MKNTKMETKYEIDARILLQLQQLQQMQLSMMDKLHEICCANKIEYYIIAGTLLGSIRHGGFIPWDVDVDVAMTRDNYRKLKDFCNSTNNLTGFDFVNYEKDPLCHTGHGFFVCRSSDVRFVGGGAKYGAFIDIFPLDKAPEDSYLQKKHAQKIAFCKKLIRLVAQSSNTSGSNAFFKWLPKFFLRCLCKIYPLARMNAKLETIMQEYSNSSSRCLCSMYFQSYEKQCMDRDVYGTPKLVKFEGRWYFAPARSEQCLVRTYGDYMKVPTKEEIDWQLKRYFGCKSI